MATKSKPIIEKEEKPKEKVKFKSINNILFVFTNILFDVSMVSLFIYLIIEYSYKLFNKSNPFAKILYKLSISVPKNVSMGILIFFGVTLFISALIFFIKLMPPNFDFWIKDIAYKRLSTTLIRFDRKYLYIEYDIALKNQDIKDFIAEISNKSKAHSYYLVEIVIDEQYVIISPEKRREIPRKCVLENKEDTAWNIIPLGEAVNNQLKTITPIGWWLNDNIERNDVIKTLPSTSLMIAGGTGSGKSVVENGIIGHITRFPGNIQGLLIDVKKVEFGGLESYKGIKKVGTTIEDCSSIIEQARKIMYDRFSFMEQSGVNNVYKLAGKQEVDYYEIKGESFQFDEIFDCKIDGKYNLLTLDKFYEEIQKVNFADIVDYNFKGLTRITKNDIKKTKGLFNPKAILILVDELGEVMNDSNYRMVSTIQTNLGSIARLGRAAGVHLCLATQRPSGDVINSDLKNNIQMGVLLGDFDSSASSLIFDKDISDICKPEIKGRGYIRSGKDIVEFQSYWTEKEKDFALKSEKVLTEVKEVKVENEPAEETNKIQINKDKEIEEFLKQKAQEEAGNDEVQDAEIDKESEDEIRQEIKKFMKKEPENKTLKLKINNTSMPVEINKEVEKPKNKLKLNIK